MAMRGTTPSFIVHVPGVDLNGKTIYLTIDQKGKQITKTNDEVMITVGEDESVIALELSQLETLGFTSGSAKVQLRYIDANGKALGTKKANFYIDDILLEGVITYKEGD